MMPPKMSYVPNKYIIEDVKRFLQEVDFFNIEYENLNNSNLYSPISLTIRQGKKNKTLEWIISEPSNETEHKLKKIENYFNNLLFNSSEYKILPDGKFNINPEKRRL